MKPRLYFDTSMKMKAKKEKAFDTIKVFIEIKEKIAKETEKMTFAEFKEYLNKTNSKIGFAYFKQSGLLLWLLNC